MRVDLRLGGLITVGGRDIALGKTHALLDGIARERSVSGAAQRLGVSYRAAWGQVLALEEALGRPVAVKTKGHGSVLTEFGAAWRDALAATLAAFEGQIAQERQALEQRLADLVGAADAPLRLALSHDPLLARVLAGIPEIEAAIEGSGQALARLRDGAADAAGFHTGGDPAGEGPAEDLAGDPAFIVAPLFTREQGLMLTPGNPLAIRGVADLAVRGARVVNRQRGSGTRAWFDRLLAETGVTPSRIRGYAVEEFTHQAVAAVIAAGEADAGMGVRAVAERFGLAFIPLGAETYFLAARRDVAGALLDRLRAGIRAALGEMPGYALPNPPGTPPVTARR
ncbi:MAG TPA: substrate-binding domain-containing protein [Microvirga sp.]|jgi:molybdate transport repressor ModE-like protein|nr:substrate-binding domain-containing protein [Microvirga sp.]